MKNTATEKIKNTRLARKAQIDSGLHYEIQKLRKEIVINSFSTNFDRVKHAAMMNRLKVLKAKYKGIATN